MAAHRYWRLSGMRSQSGGMFEAREIHFLSGTTRVGQVATMSVNKSATVGAASNLFDGSESTSAEMPPETVFNFDFGPGNEADVTDVRFLSSRDRMKFPRTVVVSYSDDQVTWKEYFRAVGLKWPGEGTFTNSVVYGGWIGVTHQGDVSISADGRTASFIPPITSTGTSFPIMIGKTEGVLQVEFVFPNSFSGSTMCVGLYTSEAVAASAVVSTSPGGIEYQSSGQKRINNTASTYGAAWVNGDVIGMVVDFANGTVTFYKNGVSQGTAFTGFPPSIRFPMARSLNYGPTYVVDGYTRGFAYPIAGASAWESVTSRIAHTNYLPQSLVSVSTIPSKAAAMWDGKARSIDRAIRARPNYLFDQRARGRIVGSVARKESPTNVPLKRRVRVYREVDGMLIGEVWSDPVTGSYAFEYLEEWMNYTVIVYDYLNEYQAESVDGVSLANGKMTLMKLDF